jgi:hypothetical protein
MRIKKIYAVFLINFCIVVNLYAQEVQTVIVEGKYVGGQNITPEEGFKKALEDALNTAVEKVCGILVREETIRTLAETSLNSELIDQFSKLCSITKYGRVVDKEILERRLDGSSFTYFVKVKAVIVKENDLPDPNFQINLELSKPVFFVDKKGIGEEMNFKITANQDCYLYLFNLMSDDSVKLLLPSQLLPNNFYSSKSKIQEYEKKLEDIKMNVGLTSGKEMLTEGLYLIALKEKVDFKSENFSKDGTDYIPTYKAAIYDIQKWLMEIPNNKRTETLKVYEIRKFDRKEL